MLLKIWSRTHFLGLKHWYTRRNSRMKLAQLAHLFLMDSLCIQSLIFIQWPCRYYLETSLWYSEDPQEHCKRKAKCFLINYATSLCGYISWFFLPLLSIWSWLWSPDTYIMPCLILEIIYSYSLCLNTFSFPFVVLNFFI